MTQKYHIPKLCDEDWSAMTTTEKGAFCKKCQIDVIDFTNKTNAEIKSILQSNTNRNLCGNISSTQLEILNNDFNLWETQTVGTFRSKFLLACVLAFGLSLFTGCQSTDDSKKISIQEIENIADTSARGNQGSFILSTHKLGQLVPQNLGEYVANEMLLDQDYCDLIDDNKKASTK